ncbi:MULTISPECIES: polysaccharide deacetylase family protein [unclassified Streptomyces]|uniref:polysaccharide deacetylase family protein n=1 Tax=unclassified Streptomyces TaxID=2593676 RepID=UPI002E75D7EA|nr:polysaccharide deacetylase family protein [Streptomyces sp. JV176]MEE1802018.1 polysaccharide deacetylase family protein [Streptomyces sp. JV176]
MKKDQMILGRRGVLRLAACLGVAVTARLLTAGEAGTPGRPAGPPPAAGPEVPVPVPDLPPQGAAGPPAGVGLRPSAYRLQPMTEGAPSGLGRPLPPVRHKPFLELPELGHTMVLTFDDGPDPAYTPGILRTLRDHDVRAMFFVCGEMVDVHRDLLREIADDGHVIGNHSWSHPQMTKLTRSGIRGELERTSEVVEETVGAAPLWYRAPYGAWNRHSFELGAEMGMEPLAWTVDSLDWTTPGTRTIVRRVLDGAGPGVVILSHDAGGDRSQSVTALRRYLPRLLDEGYRIAVPHR